MAAKQCSSTGVRADDADHVVVPRHTLCLLVFTIGQLESRLRFRTPVPPGRVDAQILENAKAALINARAALQLAARR